MAIVGPIAPESNPPIQPQNFSPWNFIITNISIGVTTTVTMTIPTTTSLNYVIGQQVRLHVPPSFGCRKLNGTTSFVLQVIQPDQVVLDLNSSGSDPYTTSSATTKPQISAIGDINSGNLNTNGRNSNLTYIPGSFLNISN